MTIDWPQGIYLVLLLLSLGLVLAKHGEPREPYNIWVTLFGTALTLALLYWGGFFG